MESDATEKSFRYMKWPVHLCGQSNGVYLATTVNTWRSERKTNLYFIMLWIIVMPLLWVPSNTLARKRQTEVEEVQIVSWRHFIPVLFPLDTNFTFQDGCVSALMASCGVRSFTAARVNKWPPTPPALQWGHVNLQPALLRGRFG